MIFATAIHGEPTVVQYLAHPGRARKLRPLVSQIQRVVAAHFDIDPDEMKTEARAWAVSHPRQVAMCLAYELTRHSLPAIGKMFGGRDHTTVIRAIRAVNERAARSVADAADLEILRESLLA